MEEARRKVEEEDMRLQREDRRKQEQDDYFLALKIHEQEKLNATGKTHPPTPPPPRSPSPTRPMTPPSITDASRASPLATGVAVPQRPPPSYEST